jgi:hypothetical protein
VLGWKYNEIPDVIDYQTKFRELGLFAQKRFKAGSIIDWNRIKIIRFHSRK